MASIKTLCIPSILSLAIAIPAMAQAKSYNLRDLQALAASQNWRELSEHLDDISPSKRDQNWQAIAQKTALGIFSEAAKQSNLQESLSLGEALLKRYPAIKSDRAVMTKRAEVGLKAYEQCFSQPYNTDECNSSFKTFINNDPTNSDLAFRAGKLVRLNAKHWVALPYFRQALANPSPQISRQCNDPDLKLALISGLNLPESYEAILQDTRAIAAGTCWNDLRPTLTSELKNGNSYFKANFCPILRRKNAIGSVEAAFCQP
jgi:hypothetical protein